MEKVDSSNPLHLNATPEDLRGNNEIGRYIILCGSRKRVRVIAQLLEQVNIKENHRGHDLYLGLLKTEKKPIDVAVISTGMGAASTDIILNELIQLGGKRFLRIGTAGSLQPHFIKTGDVVIATAAVRDEHTSQNYIDLGYPAIASLDIINASIKAAEMLKLQKNTFPGIVHSKDSFYAREMGVSLLKHNFEFMENLRASGVLATEMECSIIFVLSNLLSYRNSKQYQDEKSIIKAGAILAIVGDCTTIEKGDQAQIAEQRAISIGLETIKILALSELK